jgi:YHS domain-containing protein
MKTRNGVYYDLTHSCYRVTVDGLTFVFSSKSHKDKFKKKLKENREIVNYSLTKRFKLTVNVSQLADIVLYRKIETRGFLILTNEGNSICQKSVKFVGGKVIMPN